MRRLALALLIAAITVSGCTKQSTPEQTSSPDNSLNWAIPGVSPEPQSTTKSLPTGVAGQLDTYCDRGLTDTKNHGAYAFVDTLGRPDLYSQVRFQLELLTELSVDNGFVFEHGYNGTGEVWRAIHPATDEGTDLGCLQLNVERNTNGLMEITRIDMSINRNGVNAVWCQIDTGSTAAHNLTHWLEILLRKMQELDHGVSNDKFVNGLYIQKAGILDEADHSKKLSTGTCTMRK